MDTFEAASLSVGNTTNVVLEMDVSTALNQAPTQPELLTPEDEATGLDTNITLTWESDDADEDDLSYSLEIRNDFNNETIRINNISNQNYALENLKFGGKYFWQVIVSDRINPEVASAIHSFTIKNEPENRFLYVKNEGDNNVIYSANFNFQTNEKEDEFQLTDDSINSWRLRKNNTSNLIAFLRMKENEVHIYTMKSNGDNVQQVTSSVPVTGFNFKEIDFAWSPNGNRILYPHLGKLYMINID